MPGRGSYGPGGRWIHDRAHKLMSRNPDMEKGKAYAIATQQAHRVGKSPKRFRTSGGVAAALAKHRRPTSEYRKTASKGLTSQEKAKITNKGKFVGGLSGLSIGGLGAHGISRKIDKSKVLAKLPVPAQLAVGLGLGVVGAGGGSYAGKKVGKKVGQGLWKRKDREMRKAAQLAFFDELEKISSLMSATRQFGQSRRVGQLGTKKPPDPNIRAVSTKV